MSSLAVFAIANIAAASSGGLFKPGAWYESLNKPGWTPPNWAFPIVWTALFAMNAAAGWLVWRAEAGEMATIAAPMIVYGVGLAVNFMWSGLFFGAKRMGLALADVALLWLLIALQIALFARHDVIAAALGLPYLAWVSIAAALNLRMMQLNPR